MASTDMTRLAQLRRLRTLRADAPKAASTGQEVVWNLLDQQAFMKVYRDINKEDPVTGKLLYSVLQGLQDQFDVKSNTYNALNRIRQLVKAGSGWKIDLQRNNIFKAANLMGIRLPHGMFASTKTAADDAKWFKGEIEKALQILEDACDVADQPGGLSSQDGKVQGAVNDIRKKISRDLAKHSKAIK